jgi:hypothetical protein
LDICVYQYLFSVGSFDWYVCRYLVVDVSFSGVGYVCELYRLLLMFPLLVISIVFCVFSNGVYSDRSSGPEVDVDRYVVLVLRDMWICKVEIMMYKVTITMIFVVTMTTIFFMGYFVVVAVVAIDLRYVWFLKTSFSMVNLDRGRVDPVLEFFLFCCRLFVAHLGRNYEKQPHTILECPIRNEMRPLSLNKDDLRPP